MHMTDALLSPAVGAAMCAVGAAANAYAVKKIKKDDLCDKKIPIMGVMGAFVFAAQMINFTIPATGSSGHIGGGILLAAMIGGFPALLCISAVLVIQCLFFADGGLLALGCNIFNLGVIPCLAVYPLVFKPMVKKAMTTGKITAASVIASVLALQLGAFCVVLQTALSGVAELPFLPFLALMQPIHLAIGAAEGFITAAILCFVYKMRPEIMESAVNRTAISKGIPVKNTIIVLVLVTLLAGGVLVYFASSHPDGLEWSIEKITEKTAETENGENSENESTGYGAPAAGIAGEALTFALAGAGALVISIFKKKRKGSSPA